MSVVKNFQKDWKKSGLKEKFFMVAGVSFLVLAVIGIFLPLIPQVPFAVLSAVFFSYGSPSTHQWIRNNKYFGQPVKDWEDHRVIRPKLKFFSFVGLSILAVFCHWKILLHWALVADGILLAMVIFIFTRDSSARAGKK